VPEFPKGPIVFHFQPESYEVVDTPEKLKVWEKNMREAVGLEAVTGSLAGSATQCSCNGGLLDDSDWHHA
jgi:hypothetical protein